MYFSWKGKNGNTLTGIHHDDLKQNLPQANVAVRQLLEDNIPPLSIGNTDYYSNSIHLPLDLITDDIEDSTKLFYITEKTKYMPLI